MFGQRVIPVLMVTMMVVSSLTQAAEQTEDHVVEGTISKETFPYYQARMYALPASEVWKETRALLKTLGLKQPSLDREVGGLVTKHYGFAGPGERPPAPDLRDGWEGESFQLFVWIPQFIEPARVYVESVVHSGDRVYYGAWTPGDWFFSKLEARLGGQGRPVPQNAYLRHQLALKLLGDRDGVSECLVPAEAKGIVAKGTPYKPRRKRDYKPVYPWRYRAIRQPIKIFMQGFVQEDGVVREVTVVKMDGDPVADEVPVSAVQGVLLWRYLPAVTDEDCPIEVPFLVQVDYN